MISSELLVLSGIGCLLTELSFVAGDHHRGWVVRNWQIFIQSLRTITYNDTAQDLSPLLSLASVAAAELGKTRIVVGGIHRALWMLY